MALPRPGREQVRVCPVHRRLAGVPDAAPARRRRPGDSRHAGACLGAAARTSSKHLLHLLQTLEKTQPGGETSMAPLWHDWPARSAVAAWSSSCRTASSRCRRCCTRCGTSATAGHEVLLFHILAPEEIEFPFKNGRSSAAWRRGRRSALDARSARREYLQNFETFCGDLRTRRRRHADRLPPAAHRHPGRPRLAFTSATDSDVVMRSDCGSHPARHTAGESPALRTVRP